MVLPTLPPVGVIPLEDKALPTENLPPSERSSIACCRLRHSNLDVTQIRDRLLTLHIDGNIWDANKQASNLYVPRPYHDKLGIGNVCFIYCDDAAQNCYRFPWFLEWKEELESIFKQIGVSSEQVIRCVFACLPAGVTIPVHHDSGRWVEVAHRIHVPLVTNPGVTFFAGADEASLEEYHLPVGTCVELNNHAKHKVINNGASGENIDNRRVHLIFDYLDLDCRIPTIPHQLPTIQLDPNSKIVRHRRHIEVLTEDRAKWKELKYFVIIGAQKCGTSSVYHYICQHPSVVKARTKETHFFDWGWPENPSNKSKPQNLSKKQIKLCENLLGKIKQNKKNVKKEKKKNLNPNIKNQKSTEKKSSSLKSLSPSSLIESSPSALKIIRAKYALSALDMPQLLNHISVCFYH
eukprot:GSMAST32.ASY1.ANO1.323.1 assembled CDS